MQKLRCLSAFTLALALAACGGGNKPAESASQESAASTPRPLRPSPARLTGPAAGSSEDVSKGTAAIKAGDWNAARATRFESAIKKNPKQADAHYYLGLVMDKTGDRPSAESTTAMPESPSLIFQEAAENLAGHLPSKPGVRRRDHHREGVLSRWRGTADMPS